MKNCILEAKNIKKSYGDDHVLNIDQIKIYQSSFNFLIGPNGSGKTTLLNILSMIDVDYKGQVYYRGVKVVKEKMDLLKLRREFSVIWQNPYLYHGTVAHNIGLPLKIRNKEQKKVKRKVFDIAEKLDIKHLLNKESNQISGGERQKVSIARALITDPEILFIDEPNSSLDYESSRYFNNLFTELTANGVTILLITHDLYQIEHYADYITVLNQGEVVASGPKEEVDF